MTKVDDSSPPMISILMPVFNAEQYLCPCLESIQKQSYLDWELIAVDDQSDDRSGDILRAFAQMDRRIKVFRTIEKGVIPALELAYSRSGGQYITRMDADDLMRPERVRYMFNQLTSAGPGYVAVGQVKYFRESGLGAGYKRYEHWLNGLIAQGSCFNEIYRECVIPSPCWMLRREDLDLIGAFDRKVYPEDYDLCFRMARAGLKPLPCDQVLLDWRDYAERSSRTDPNYMDNRFLDLKCTHYFEWSRDRSRELVLWGAGDKGKWITKWINAKGEHVNWACDTSTKIGQTIYGHVLQSADSLLAKSQRYQWIIAISNPDVQIEITSRLESAAYRRRIDFDFFC